MPVTGEDRQPDARVGLDLVEDVGRVAVSEVPDPAAYEGVDLSHDDVDRRQQP
jgi:hypothetical protein